MSSPSSRSSLYWEPEQPPPSTLTRSHASSSPLSSLSLETAVSVITRLFSPLSRVSAPVAPVLSSLLPAPGSLRARRVTHRSDLPTENIAHYFNSYSQYFTSISCRSESSNIS